MNMKMPNFGKATLITATAKLANIGDCAKEEKKETFIDKTIYFLKLKYKNFFKKFVYLISVKIYNILEKLSWKKLDYVIFNSKTAQQVSIKKSATISTTIEVVVSVLTILQQQQCKEQRR